MKKVGILALQGDFAEHAEAVSANKFEPKLVKNLADLNEIDRLIIPGGESTSIGLLLEKNKLIQPIKQFIKNKNPVWGTCAGLILLADKIENQKQDGQISIGGLPVTVRRNFLGGQKFSIEASLNSNEISNEPFKALFIRPPQIIKTKKKIKVLASHKFNKTSSPVAVRYENILATTFHSEHLSSNPVTKYFLQMGYNI